MKSAERFERMDDDRLRKELEDNGLLHVTRRTVTDETVFEAVREVGLPSMYIDSAGGVNIVPSFASDPEGNRIEQGLVDAVEHEIAREEQLSRARESQRDTRS